MDSLQQDIETLRSIKPFLSEALSRETDRSEWLQHLTPTAADLLERLAQADDAEIEMWSKRIAAEDPQLADIAQAFCSATPPIPAWLEEASVFKFADRITDVEFSAHLSFEIEYPRPIIRLIFLAGEESERLAMTSDQDLEDTLSIGASVCDAVAQTLRLAHEHKVRLGLEHFGEEFGDRIQELEEVIRTLRRYHNRMLKASKKNDQD